MKKSALLICLLCLSVATYAQKYEWVKFYQGQSVQQLSSTSADDDGNVYFTINFHDHIVTDSFTLTGSTGAYRAFISKKNSKGKTLWYKVGKTVNNSNCMAIGSTFLKNGNQLVFIDASADIVIDNDTIKRSNTSNRTLFIVEVNPGGKLVSGRELLSGNLLSNYYVTKNFCNDENDNIYISLRYNAPIKIYDTIGITTIGTSQANFILKFSHGGKVFKWYKELPGSIITNNIDTDIHGNVYLASYWENSPSSFVFKTQTINKPQATSGCVFIFDKNGADKNWFHVLASGNESSIAGVAAHDSNSVFVTGNFKGDSARFDNKWKKSKSPDVYHFIAKYNINGKLAWEKHQDTSYTTIYNKHNDYGSIANFKDQYFYVSILTGSPFNKLTYDGQEYKAPNTNWGINLKLDDRGNILWGFRTFYPFTGMGTDRQSNLYFGGYFENDSVAFGPFKAKGFQGDAFVGKTFDYAIFRGPVKSGPYCAGDTFKISYTKIGEYGDSNVFYAELSDEEGEFTGKERILGSLKSKDSGTIIGTLPLFEVASSKKYRIRIRSTLPQAQSFYKLDTLRLLIYSRDKAEPGPPEFICRGDTFMIKTFGGTKWTWSPKYRMNDSNSRTPLVWPDKTTQYRIIIADSSGCGEADTAFKTVIVRKDPKIRFITAPDTIVCKGSTANIIASFMQGDSLTYAWDWYAVSPQGNYTFLKTGSGKQADSLKYKMPVNEKDSQLLVLFLRDGCALKTDVAYYTIMVNKERPKISFPGKDTSVCPGKPISIIASFRQGNIPGYNWQWYEMNTFGQWIPGIKSSGNIFDTLLYTLPLNWKKNKLIRVILNDNCASLPDTSVYTLIPRDTLQIKLNTGDTLLCKGQTYTWKVSGKGGDNNAYAYKWINTIDGQILSSSDSLKLSADSTIVIRVQLEDGCMPQSISRTFTLNSRPGLEGNIIDINNNQLPDTTLCYGQFLRLHSSSSGGNGKYTYQWQLDGQAVSNTDSLNINLKDHFSKTGDSGRLVFILGDQCTIKHDSSFIRVKMLPAIEIQGTVTDSVCYLGKAKFRASGKGGTGDYKFKWWDAGFAVQGNTDSLIVVHSNPAQSGTITRFAAISDACSSPADTIQLKSFFRSKLSLTLKTTDTCNANLVLLNADLSGGKGYGYSVTWWKEHALLGSSKGTITVLPDAARVHYKAVVNDGCSPSSDTASIYLGLSPNLKLQAEGFCLGDTTFIKLGSSKLPTVYKWQVNDKDIAVSDSLFNPVFPDAGNYKVEVHTSNANCPGADSIYFRIVEKPVADFEYAHLAANTNGIPFHFINRSSHSNAWLWTFDNGDTSNDNSPDHTFSDTGFSKVRLIANNMNLCFDTIEKTIPVMEDVVFFFPNTFSPDGNGLNEGFGLDESQHHLVKEFHIDIYNRWGEKVFESDDVREFWNGGNFQQGVYVYMVSIRDVYDILHDRISGFVGVYK